LAAAMSGGRSFKKRLNRVTAEDDRSTRLWSSVKAARGADRSLRLQISLEPSGGIRDDGIHRAGLGKQVQLERLPKGFETLQIGSPYPVHVSARLQQLAAAVDLRMN
jgi:hypothetical protein